MPRSRFGRVAGGIAVCLVVLSTASFGATASASSPMKAKKYQACWYFTDSKDETITCDIGFRAPAAKVVLDGQCWTYVVEGAYAQERIKGAWVDRPDIPVTWSDHAFCPADTPHASVLTVTIPVAPIVLHTYRVAIPETETFRATVGDPMTACVRWTKSEKYCGD